MSERTFAKVGYKNAAGTFIQTSIRAQDVETTTGITAESHITNAEIHLTAAQIAAINGAIQDTEKGAASGVATLDANAKLTASQMPASVVGGMTYQGGFNATTGEDGDGNELPTPAAANKGFYWVCTTGGTFDETDYNIGDWIASNGATFDKLDHTDAVTSVAGKVGEVALVKGDVGLGNVDNTADADKVVASAGKLTTPRTINGVAFDGTANITITTVDQTARDAASAADTAAGAAQDAADAAQATADAAALDAAKLDAAYCTSESDMASKNLRVGALVLMEVSNDAVDSAT